MCNSYYAYEITEETWYKVGVANGHKREFSELLTELQTVAPGARLFATFATNG